MKASVIWAAACALLIIACGDRGQLTRSQASEILEKALSAAPPLEAHFSEGYICEPRDADMGPELFTARVLDHREAEKNGTPVPGPALVAVDQIAFLKFGDIESATVADRHRCSPAFHFAIDRVQLTEAGKKASDHWKKRTRNEPFGDLVATWAVPIATRALVEVTGIAAETATNATVEYSWRWRATPEAQQTFAWLLIKQFAPGLDSHFNQKWSNDPGNRPHVAAESLQAIEGHSEKANASLKQFDDGWRVVKLLRE